MKPLVKVTEFYDSNEKTEKIDASCIGCGKHILKMVRKNGALIVNEYSKCECPDVQHFEITEEMAANNKYDNTVADMKFGKIAQSCDKLEKEVDMLWPASASEYRDKDGKRRSDYPVAANFFDSSHTPA